MRIGESDEGETEYLISAIKVGPVAANAAILSQQVIAAGRYRLDITTRLQGQAGGVAGDNMRLQVLKSGNPAGGLAGLIDASSRDKPPVGDTSQLLSNNTTYVRHPPITRRLAAGEVVHIFAVAADATGTYEAQLVLTLLD